MASAKKRHKAANLAAKQKLAQKGQLRQREGDRRRRGAGQTYEEGLARKRLLQQRARPTICQEEE